MAVERAPYIFIITGEPSGDALGGALIAALRRRAGDGLRIAGIGGERMREQGIDSLAPLSDLAIAGVTEVVPPAFVAATTSLCVPTASAVLAIAAVVQLLITAAVSN